MADQENTSFNPASRLYSILDEALQEDGSSRVSAVWSKVFGLPPNRPDLVFKGVTRLIELADETEKRIRELEGINEEPYLKSFDNIKQIVQYPNLHNNWGKISNRLT